MSSGEVMRQVLAAREQARAERVEVVRASFEAALPALVDVLKARGASRIWLFGSLAWGQIAMGSDIDLAVEGLAPEHQMRTLGELLLLAPGRVDLVRLEDAGETLAERIFREGRLLHG